MADAYRTVAEFKQWVGLSDGVDDPTIAGVLSAASQSIDHYCNTHFWKTPAATTRVFDTCDAYRLRIGDAAAITEVATDKDSDGTFETVWAAGDYQLWPLNPAAGPEVEPYTQIFAIGAQTFPRATRRQGLIRVTGTWGWAAVPEAVVQATLLLTNRLLKRRGSPEGVSRSSDFGIFRITTRDDPDVVRLLDPYRTNRRAGGWALA